MCSKAIFEDECTGVLGSTTVVDEFEEKYFLCCDLGGLARFGRGVVAFDAVVCVVEAQFEGGPRGWGCGIGLGRCRGIVNWCSIGCLGFPGRDDAAAIGKARF